MKTDSPASSWLYGNEGWATSYASLYEFSIPEAIHEVTAARLLALVGAHVLFLLGVQAVDDTSDLLGSSNIGTMRGWISSRDTLTMP